ncbi:MAG: glycosyltransferase family 2 protein, partial [Chlorobiaceae bacterium]
MMIVGFLLIKSLLILLALPAGYLLMSTIASYFFKKEEPISNQFLNIGVLIPAHNEEEGIKRTIENILASDYPANRFELFVIADNCTDSTATNAREAGAQVFERFNELKRGKGEALDWFLKNCKENYQATNAITIIDADVCPDKNYLREISASLSNPEIEAVQAFNGVSNPQAGWRTALIDAAFNVFNHLRMAGSFRMSGSAILRGNGMGFRTELLEHYG